ncbi:hypothetical protein OCK74_15185 [Chitinophagaceae bacterium LB-8]|uniref:N-acetylglucosamine-6-phosphate deacetylase n=1 Tax=Paraflavisolibacter caeni TaxID=2982496 RepID=A0A9X3BG83_9BACT|nr:hypothetical protein [Paraflavisolibacter caeni]MCU7550464.1 hypothetical protein [Paraflavisolibacter caeni]
MRTAIVNGKVFTGEKVIDNVIIVIENGRVCAIEDSIPGDARVINLEGWNIAPGFIDIQINGGSKHYFFKGISLVTHLYNAMT